MALFPSDLAALIFEIVVIIWVLGEIVGGGIIPRLRRQGTRITRRDRGTCFAIIGGVWVSVFVALIFGGMDIARLPGWVAWAGFALMLIGIIIRQWAIASLGRYFSPSVATQTGQKVVKTGPYRLIRHPSYTGALLITVGVGLALQSWGAVLVILVIFVITFGSRMRMEEKVLVNELGDEYLQYMKTTKRIIPYII
jgi:protein-S-isoprenylcysteine O-methyltransferase Ste14